MFVDNNPIEPSQSYINRTVVVIATDFTFLKCHKRFTTFSLLVATFYNLKKNEDDEISFVSGSHCMT